MDILQKYMLHALFIVHTVLPQCERMGPCGLLKAFVSKTEKSKLLQGSMNTLSLHSLYACKTYQHNLAAIAMITEDWSKIHIDR